MLRLYLFGTGNAIAFRMGSTALAMRTRDWFLLEFPLGRVGSVGVPMGLYHCIRMALK